MELSFLRARIRAWQVVQEVWQYMYIMFILDSNTYMVHYRFLEVSLFTSFTCTMYHLVCRLWNCDCDMQNLEYSKLWRS